MKGILIIQSMGLGDLIFTLPILQTLKRNYPEEPLTFLTHENYASILSLVPEIDSVITYANKSPLSLLKLVLEIRRRHFEKVFVLNPIFRGSLLAWLSGAPTRVGYERDFERKQSLHGFQNLLTHRFLPKNEKRHEVDRYLDLLENFGIEIQEKDRVPKLRLSELPPHFPGKAITINLGTAWINRRWPKERIAALSHWLIEAYNAQLYYCGGISESKLAEEILREPGIKGINLCGKTTLPELAVHLKRCHLFVTSDTGSLHIAAALEVPTLAFYGPGDLEKVSPRSSQTQVFYHKMPCSPCQFQYTRLCQNNLCMQEIQVEDVIEGAKKVLGNPEVKINSQEMKRIPQRKILYLQSTSEVGGTDVTLLRTLEALDKKAYEPHVLIPKEGPFSEAYRKLGCKLHVVPSMLKMTRRRGNVYALQFLLGYFPAVFKIADIIRKEKIDLVHTNTIHNLYGFLAAKFAGVLHVWHIREIVVQSGWMRQLEIFLVKNFSTRFIAMDNAISEMFLSKNRGYPQNIVKFYDGVNLEKFNPQRSGARILKELNIPENTALVGTVTRLDPWKGLDHFIDAAKIIYSHHPETHFLICGGKIEGHPEYEQKLQNKIKDAGLEKVFHMTGWTYFGDAIPEVYRALTVSVQCPIFPEPYGLANIEAMASGIPTVAFAEGGPLEICVDSKTGYLVSPRDSQAAAKAVLSLLKNPESAQKMGLEGRKRAERLFDHQKCTRHLEALYADILDPKL